MLGADMAPLLPFLLEPVQVNVHPFEFVSGEFLHLGCVMALNAVGIDVHALTIFVFIVFGGIMASLNHTRADVRVRVLSFCTLLCAQGLGSCTHAAFCALPLLPLFSCLP